MIWRIIAIVSAGALALAELSFRLVGGPRWPWNQTSPASLSGALLAPPPTMTTSKTNPAAKAHGGPGLLSKAVHSTPTMPCNLSRASCRLWASNQWAMLQSRRAAERARPPVRMASKR